MFSLSSRILSLALSALLVAVPSASAEKKAIRPPMGPGAGPYSAGMLAGDFLYVSGHVGPEPGGGFAPGDVKTQTRRCLELVGKVLREAGLDYSHVVSATLYLTDIRTLDAADAAWREFFPGPVRPARVEIESPLLIAEALSEVSVIAVRSPAGKQAIRVIEPQGWKAPAHPVSHAILAGGTLFFSTLRPVDPATGELVGGASLAAQTAQVVRNQEALLQAAGMGKDDMASARIFVTDARHGVRYPGSASMAQSVGVAGPYQLGHLLQVQVVAHAKGKGPVYVDGMSGRGAGIAEQTRDALRRIEAEFQKRGYSLADSVEAVVWLRDARDAAAMNAVYRELVKPNPAARATVRLAPVELDSRIVITMTGYR